MLLYPIRVEYWNKLWSYLSSLEGIKELTFKFSGSAAGLFGDSFPFLGGITEFQVRVFPTTGPRSEAGNVVVHRGLHTPMLDARYSVVMLMGYVVDWNCMSMDLEVTVRGYHNGVRIGNAYGNGGCSCLNLYYLTGEAYGEICALLICASFGSTRLICASFGSTRLICASFGSTRLICAFYGTTRLLCRVRAQRGADRREAERTREGHMDAFGFLIASAMYILSEYLVCDFELMT
ncbi:hypothetical protein E5676_scaffold121G00210 [Cucumis melo var. makuwa]|uniref:Uncharacterized protein n=1 Tax=Cucumis melo var. makuwa TaxID=1194695 RepID=A0A5D3BUR2_CUCMM|nr:hypothetical protein E5676_scaffold121G00210 [Cucumis melo var. makuwa]